MVGTTSHTQLRLLPSRHGLAETTPGDSCPAILGHPAAIPSTQEELAAYLTQEIFPQLAPPPYVAIEVTVLSQRKPVFLFREVSRDIQVTGKLFACYYSASQEAWMAAERGYFNLRVLRGADTVWEAAFVASWRRWARPGSWARSAQFGFRKPDPRLFTIACSLLGVPAVEAVCVGNDREKDVEGAKRAELKVVLVDRDHNAAAAGTVPGTAPMFQREGLPSGSAETGWLRCRRK